MIMMKQILNKMENDFKEFKKKINKVTEPRNHEIKGSYGVKDYFNHYRFLKGKKHLKREQFDKIIRGVNYLFGVS